MGGSRVGDVGRGSGRKGGMGRRDRLGRDLIAH